MTDKVPALTDPPEGYADWLANLKGRANAAPAPFALRPLTPTRSASSSARSRACTSPRTEPATNWSSCGLAIRVSCCQRREQRAPK